jgi:hypothetical protein
VALCAVLLFIWLYEINKSQFASMIGALVFISHPSIHGLMTEISHQFKYFVPLAILLFSMIKIQKDKPLSRKKLIWILSLYSISIMTHEGSLTFAWIFILYSIFIKKFQKAQLLLLFPSIIYVFIRIFLFDIPSYGLMKTDFMKIPKGLIYFYSNLWHSFPFFNSNETNLYLGVLSFLLFLALSIVMFKKYKYPEPIRAIILSIFPLLPFSALPDHLLPSRVVWATVFCAYFYSFIVVLIKNKFSFNSNFKFKYLALILIYTLALSPKIIDSTTLFKGNYKYSYLINGTENLIEKIKTKLSNHNRGDVIAISYSPTRHIWHGRVILCGILSYYLPEYTFKLNYEGDNPGFFWIENGSYYNVPLKDLSNSPEKESIGLDPFGFPTQLNLKEPSSNIEIDNDYYLHLYYS